MSTLRLPSSRPPTFNSESKPPTPQAFSMPEPAPGSLTVKQSQDPSAPAHSPAAPMRSPNTATPSPVRACTTTLPSAPRSTTTAASAAAAAINLLERDTTEAVAAISALSLNTPDASTPLPLARLREEDKALLDNLVDHAKLAKATAPSPRPDPRPDAPILVPALEPHLSRLYTKQMERAQQQREIKDATHALNCLARAVKDSAHGIVYPLSDLIRLWRETGTILIHHPVSLANFVELVFAAINDYKTDIVKLDDELQDQLLEILQHLSTTTSLLAYSPRSLMVTLRTFAFIKQPWSPQFSAFLTNVLEYFNEKDLPDSANACSPIIYSTNYFGYLLVNNKAIVSAEDRAQFSELYKLMAASLTYNPNFLPQILANQRLVDILIDINNAITCIAPASPTHKNLTMLSFVTASAAFPPPPVPPVYDQLKSLITELLPSDCIICPLKPSVVTGYLADFIITHPQGWVLLINFVNKSTDFTNLRDYKDSTLPSRLALTTGADSTLSRTAQAQFRAAINAHAATAPDALPTVSIPAASLFVPGTFNLDPHSASDAFSEHILPAVEALMAESEATTTDTSDS